MTPLAALFLDWLLTGFWPITGKAAFAYADPLLFGEAALVLALLMLLPAMLKEGRWKFLFSPGLRWHLFVMGATGSGITSYLLLTAVSLTTPANAAIVCQVEVVYSALLASWLLKERITPRQALATGLVFAGTGLILWRDLGTLHWKGDLILLLTPWMFQISHIYGKRLLGSVDPVTIAGARMFYGALSLAPFALWSLAAGQPRFSFAPAALGLLFFHAGVLSCLNLILWYLAIRDLELSKCTAVILSYPALTMLYSWALRMEIVTSAQIAGLALSIGGAAWLSFQMRPEPTPRAAQVEP